MAVIKHDPEEKSPWNNREKKSVIPQIILLTVLCMLLAYFLSKAAN